MPVAGHISTASRVWGLSTGGATQSNSPAKSWGQAERYSNRARLFSAASSNVRVKRTSGPRARVPKRLALQPVVSGGSIVFATRKSVLGAFDHATLTRGAPDQSIDSGTRDHCRLQTVLRFGVSGAGLEDVAQQMVRRNGANAPCLSRIHKILKQARRLRAFQQKTISACASKENLRWRSSMMRLSSLSRRSSGNGNLEILSRGTLQYARHENCQHRAEDFTPFFFILKWWRRYMSQNWRKSM